MRLYITLLLAALALPGRALAQATPAPSPSPLPSPAATPLQSPAPTSSPPIRWRGAITPYLWAPTLNARFHFTGGFLPGGPPPAGAIFPKTVDVNVGPNDYLSHLNSAAMIAAQITHGYDAILTDFIYLNLTSSRNTVTTLTGPLGNISVPITVTSASRLTGVVWGLAISPNIVHTGTTYVNGLFGFRYTNTTVAAGWTLTGPLGNFSRTGSVSQFSNSFAPIGGFVGHLGLGERWFIPFYGDYGVGGSIITYQALGGFGYVWGGSTILLVFRELDYNSNGGNTLVQSLKMGGPALGVTIKIR